MNIKCTVNVKPVPVLLPLDDSDITLHPCRALIWSQTGHLCYGTRNHTYPPPPEHSQDVCQGTNWQQLTWLMYMHFRRQVVSDHYCPSKRPCITNKNCNTNRKEGCYYLWNAFFNMFISSITWNCSSHQNDQ